MGYMLIANNFLLSMDKSIRVVISQPLLCPIMTNFG